MFHSPISRLFSVLFTILTCGMVVWGAPLEANKNLVSRAGTCAIGCTTGIDTVTVLARLKDDLQPKLKALDDCYTDNTDPSSVLVDIASLLNTATSKVAALDKDLLGMNNGKNNEIANLYLEIVSDIAEHFTEWTNNIGESFSNLSSSIGTALTGLQSALSGIVTSLQTLLANIIDASKPHWEQLLEQLTGHGLNVLGSLSEIINNLHGSITGS